MSYEASVIILSHNNYERTTGPCLESLYRGPEEKPYEVTVVDNASTDETPRMLEKYAREKANFKAVFNRNNRGFAGGNNDGVKEAEGDIVILLNSDTVLPEGTFGRMINHMKKNPDWGMLGPVTNAAGNEQKIYIGEDEVEKAMNAGERFCSHSTNDCFASERLDFFCVAVRMDIYNRLEGLDERFGLGYYEDVDFSIKANLSGVKMMFAEDCFVFHSAGKTFSSVGKKKVGKLMHENKKKLKKKYSGKVRLFHMRNRNMKIMEKYIEIKGDAGAGRKPDFDYKFNNRLKLAEGIYPHSPFKKIFYYMQLRSLESRYTRL
jgi:GT2 family glycosyltransferase